METDPEKQYNLAMRIINNNQSVRQIEAKLHRKRNAKEFDPKYEVIYRDIEDKFTGFFGTKVKVDAGKRAGKIVIQYKTNDELERILGLLK